MNEVNLSEEVLRRFSTERLIRELLRRDVAPEKLRPGVRPIIVCLCGSTRFIDAWRDETRRLSLEGKIVLSVGVLIHAGAEPIRDDSPEKARLDELHFRKIDLADEVFVLNVGGYVGYSTRREIDYARATGKPVAFLEVAEHGR